MVRLPEEINRKIVDHTSDVNLPYSALARDALIAEGLKPDLIITTGSPIFEVLNEHRNEINSSKVLERLGLSRKDYFVVSSHREENIDNEANFEKLSNLLNSLAKTYGKTVIVSTHLRHTQDYDAWLKILEKQTFTYIDKPTVLSRQHSEQDSKKMPKAAKAEFFELLRRHIGRTRLRRATLSDLLAIIIAIMR